MSAFVHEYMRMLNTVLVEAKKKKKENEREGK